MFPRTPKAEKTTDPRYGAVATMNFDRHGCRTFLKVVNPGRGQTVRIGIGQCKEEEGTVWESTGDMYCRACSRDNGGNVRRALQNFFRWMRGRRDGFEEHYRRLGRGIPRGHRQKDKARGVEFGLTCKEQQYWYGCCEKEGSVPGLLRPFDSQLRKPKMMIKTVKAVEAASREKQGDTRCARTNVYDGGPDNKRQMRSETMPDEVANCLRYEREELTERDRPAKLEGRRGWILVLRGDMQQAFKLGGRLDQNKLVMLDRTQRKREVRTNAGENREAQTTELNRKLRTTSIGDIYEAEVSWPNKTKGKLSKSDVTIIMTQNLRWPERLKGAPPKENPQESDGKVKPEENRQSVEGFRA
ncbi:hypothetical protein K438DRAFT_1926880 [Mycena galopus ATCC 62051]|nr:hypothetical protein K438DRAFT_1926880 [Mycena galopus ATCC 62051]